MTKNKIIWLALLAAGIILVLASQFYKSSVEDQPNSTISLAPSLENSPSPSLAVSPSTTPRLTTTRVPTRTPSPTGNSMIGILPPATCSLAGKIVYTSPNVYQSIGSILTYYNVDHPSRLIYWTISPSPDFNVGPNIFSGVSLPHGREQITATMKVGIVPQRNYTLTAKITYGQFVKGELKTLETACAGQTLIEVAY